jgi:hypothetical protein
MKKPVVGQILYAKGINNAHNRPLSPMRVSRVGRKKFYLTWAQGGLETPFFLEDWRHDAKGYSECYRLYETEQEYLDAEEASVLRGKIRDAFDFYRPLVISLPALRAAWKIIEEGKLP